MIIFEDLLPWIKAKKKKIVCCPLPTDRKMRKNRVVFFFFFGKCQIWAKNLLKFVFNGLKKHLYISSLGRQNLVSQKGSKCSLRAIKHGGFNDYNEWDSLLFTMPQWLYLFRLKSAIWTGQNLVSRATSLYKKANCSPKIELSKRLVAPAFDTALLTAFRPSFPHLETLKNNIGKHQLYIARYSVRKKKKKNRPFRTQVALTN